VTTFVLVHGSWHGAWCWERLIPELEHHGHDAIAVDLPCDDIEAGCAAYAEVVIAQTARLGDDLVLVGHSLGGLTIPLVAAARPARKLVYLCAVLPRLGLSLVDQLEREPAILTLGFGQGIARDELGREYWADEGKAIEAFYLDCPRQLASWAAARLRHQARAPGREPCPLVQWPAVECVSVLTTDDAVVNPHWSRTAALEQFGATTLELPGGHSPFLSRPAELAEALVSVCL
jgi:pimeloyl-ACP methyl ester carboxylesterase